MKGIAGAAEEDKVVMRNRFRPVSPLLAALSRGACACACMVSKIVWRGAVKRTEQTQPLALATAQQVVYGLVEAYFAAKLGVPLCNAARPFGSAAAAAPLSSFTAREGRGSGPSRIHRRLNENTVLHFPCLVRFTLCDVTGGIGWGAGATTLRSLTARPGYCWNCSIDLTISVSIPRFQYGSFTVFCPGYVFFFILRRFSLSLTDNKNAVVVAAQNILFSIVTSDSNQDLLQINNFTNANFHNQLTPKFASFSSSRLCYVKACLPATSEP